MSKSEIKEKLKAAKDDIETLARDVNRAIHASSVPSPFAKDGALPARTAAAAGNVAAAPRRRRRGASFGRSS